MKYLIFIVFFLFSAVSKAEFTSICDSNPSNEYCKNVGKKAYNNFGVPALRKIYIGPIIGVAWKQKGSLISPPGREPVRTSPRDAFYYIIGPGGVANEIFLREAHGIAPK